MEEKEEFTRRVSLLVAMPVPDAQMRELIDMLHQQGYSDRGAAEYIRKLYGADNR